MTLNITANQLSGPPSASIQQIAVKSQTDNATPASEPTDTVKLSPSAKAKSLHQQGETAKSIASAMGTDVATVDDYLNIQTAATPAAAAGGGGANVAKATASSSPNEPLPASAPESAAPSVPATK